MDLLYFTIISNLSVGRDQIVLGIKFQKKLNHFNVVYDNIVICLK